MTAATIPMGDRRWLWRDILAPLVITRVVLLWIGWLAQFIPPSSTYPLQDAVARGWQFTSYRLLDMWGRWDTGWYIGLVREGYVVRGELTTVQSNLPFFPGYPLLVRLALWLFPATWRSDGVMLAAGVLVSNVLLVAGLILLHRWVMAVTGDAGAAQRTVWYLLLFPTGFIFSCAYTEATFLFFVAAAFFAATRRAWGWVGVAALGVGLTRPLGVLIVPALLWLYLDSIQWRWRAIRANVLWIVAAPLGMLAHLAYLYTLTGDFLAPLTVQAAFFRKATWPWITVFVPVDYSPLTGFIEQFVIVLFVVVAVIACWRLPSAAYGLFALGQIVPSLFTGLLSSQLRYNMAAITPFVLLALWGRHPVLDRLIQVLFFALQVLLMAAWSRFYWVA